MRPLDLILISVLDLVVGDPEWFPHPVRGIGRLIAFFDKTFSRTRLKGETVEKGSFSTVSSRGETIVSTRDLVGQREGIDLYGVYERFQGILTALLTIGITFIVAYIFVNSLGYLAWIYVGYVCISIKDLQVKARDIHSELKRWDINPVRSSPAKRDATSNGVNKARKKLSKIVGRDTQELSKEKIITATVESIAESTNDGIIAPLFYLVLGGPILGIIYKVINTLDSMIGHKDEKYLHFGWFSAKLDDIVNYIPARICGILISIAAGKGFRTMLRDGRKHPSPNSGIPEAAMAGALGVRLGGPSYYQGELIEKPYIGEDKRQVDTNLIKEALRISLVASFLGIIWMSMAGIFIDTIKA